MLLILLKAVFTAFMLGQLGVLLRGVGGFPSQTGGVYLFDLAVIAFGLLGLISFLNSKNFKIHPFLIPFIIFGAVGGVSLILYSPTLGLTTSVVSSMYLIRFLAYVLGALVLYNMFKNRLVSPTVILKLIIYSALILVLLGFIQLLILPDFAILDPNLGWDPHKFRLSSTFFDPNFVGSYISISLGVLLLKGRVFFKKNLLVLLYVILILGLILTFSRSAWAMFAVILFVYGIKYNFKILLISLLLGFSSYFLVPRVQTRLIGITDPADSAAFRLVSWRNTMEIANKHLFLGVGYNSFRFVQKEEGYLPSGSYGDHSSGGSDSSLLLVLATSGVLGLFVFIIGLIRPLRANLYWQIILPGLLVNSLFINSLFYPQILFVWLTLLVSDS